MFGGCNRVQFFGSNTVPPTVGGTRALPFLGSAFWSCFWVLHLVLGFLLHWLPSWVSFWRHLTRPSGRLCFRNRLTPSANMILDTWCFLARLLLFCLALLGGPGFIHSYRLRSFSVCWRKPSNKYRLSWIDLLRYFNRGFLAEAIL